MSNMGLAQIQIQEIEGQLLVDSRLIASRLGIQHDTLFATIEKYLERLSAKSEVRFKIEFRERPQGGKSKVRYAFLDERQATLLMTYSRNTTQVLNCKDDLVDAFEKAKAVIKTVVPAQHNRIKELELELKIREIDHAMVTLHGKETVLALRGCRDQIVETKTVVTEVVNPVTSESVEILSAEQLKQVVKKRTGQKLSSLKWFVERLRAQGRDDLLVPVTRSQTAEYLPPNCIDEALDVVYGRERQRLIGE
jgi:phage regulator Rha-like protein